MKKISELKNYDMSVVIGGLCDCYCYPKKATEGKTSKKYCELPHHKRCRNYCLMNDMEFDKCVYPEKDLGLWSGNPQL